MTMQSSTSDCYSHSSRGHRVVSCKLKLLATLALLLCFHGIVQGVGGAENEKQVYKAEVPSDVPQEISIRIAKPDEEDKGANPQSQSRQISINDDEEGGGGSESPIGGGGGGQAAIQSTTWDKCPPGSKCCYQYTWLGYKAPNNIPSPANSTCEYLKKAERDESKACFDPIVFTEAAADDSPKFTPPDLAELIKRAKQNNWPIYCPKTDTCVTYTFYSNDGSRRMTNQTKFCGVVTNTNSQKRINSGCYTEKLEGQIREVCVCSGNFCNGQSPLIAIPGLLYLLITLTSAGINNIL